MNLGMKALGAMMIAGLTGCGAAVQKAAEEVAAGGEQIGTFWECNFSDQIQMDVIRYVTINESASTIETGSVLFDSTDGTCSGDTNLMAIESGTGEVVEGDVTLGEQGLEQGAIDSIQNLNFLVESSSVTAFTAAGLAVVEQMFPEEEAELEVPILLTEFSAATGLSGAGETKYTIVGFYDDKLYFGQSDNPNNGTTEQLRHQYVMELFLDGGGSDAVDEEEDSDSESDSESDSDSDSDSDSEAEQAALSIDDMEGLWTRCMNINGMDVLYRVIIIPQANYIENAMLYLESSDGSCTGGDLFVMFSSGEIATSAFTGEFLDVMDQDLLADLSANSLMIEMSVMSAQVQANTPAAKAAVLQEYGIDLGDFATQNLTQEYLWSIRPAGESYFAAVGLVDGKLYYPEPAGQSTGDSSEAAAASVLEFEYSPLD